MKKKRNNTEHTRGEIVEQLEKDKKVILEKTQEGVKEIDLAIALMR